MTKRQAIALLKNLVCLQAFVEGKQIQCKLSSGRWGNTDDPYFANDSIEFRVKPEPFQIELWIDKDGNLVRNGFWNDTQLADGGYRKVKLREVEE